MSEGERRQRSSKEGMKYTENEILESLKKDRESGAAMVMEEYAGLLWSVCRKHLDDAEDVKECVNSTFADFCLCPEKYDESKGSLKNYLCRIAEHKAIDRYQSNCRRQQAEEAAEQNLDCEKKAAADREKTAQYLEAALDQLEPVDSQILRMKYYDGMSYQEIAGKLGLKESAVKMRSMRSRRKLLRILIAILVMLLLAACVAAVMRHYQFSERGGVVWSEKSKIYELADGDWSWEAEYAAYTVEDAVFILEDEESLEGFLTVYVGVEIEDYSPLKDLTIREEINSEMVRLNCEGDDREHHEYSTTYEYPFKYMRSDKIAMGLIEQQIAEFEVRFEWKMESRDQSEIVIPLYRGTELLMELVLKPAVMKDYDASGKSIEMVDGIKWTPGPALAGEHFTVVNFLQSGESDWQIANQLNGTKYGFWGRDSDEITLTDENGNKYGLQYAEYNVYPYTDTMVSEQYDLYFMGVPAGEYIMTIPWIFLERDWTTDEFVLELPKELNERLECDVTALFPDGSGIRITGITKTERVDTIWEQESIDAEIVEKKECFWEYVLDIERIIVGEPAFHMAVLECMDGIVMNSSIDKECVLAIRIHQGRNRKKLR